jgi:HSP20 family protein
LRRNFDELFGSMWGGFPLSSGWFDRDFESMRVWDFDVKENDKEISVRAEVPGFDENELDVQLNDNVLTIRHDGTEDTGLHRQGRPAGQRLEGQPGADEDVREGAEVTDPSKED